MGGNALAHCTRRHSEKEFWPKANLIVVRLERCLRSYDVRPTQSYWTKESFGDLDIVLTTNVPNWVEVVLNEFRIDGEPSWVHNGNILSIAIDELQVDLIKVSEADYLPSTTYFDYNDLWNLIGRLSNKIGIKTASNGLWVVLRASTQVECEHIIGQVCLSKDIRSVLPLLGMSRDRYYLGFERLEEIFEFVATSKYFHPDIFLLENRNSDSKIRDRKRKTYQLFLDWCKENRDRLPKYEHYRMDDRGGYSIREPYFSEVVVPEFPFVKGEVQKIVDAHQVSENFKKIFNGGFVSEITGKKDKELGKYCSDLKRIFSDKQFFIDNSDLVTPILEVYHERQQNCSQSS